MRRGLLFIVSAPSGTGKTTLVAQLVKTVPELVVSRSYTSRPPRPGEADGVDYNFVDDDRFTALVDAGGLLEWATVFGRRYGTGREETERQRRAGRDVVLVIDVQGARQVRGHCPDAIAIFVLPPSFHVLEQRLRQRSGGDVGEQQIRRRLDTARREVAASGDYDYLVVNDHVDRCVAQLRSIVMAERARTPAVDDTVTDIVAAFRAPDG